MIKSNFNLFSSNAGGINMELLIHHALEAGFCSDGYGDFNCDSDAILYFARRIAKIAMESPDEITGSILDDEDLKKIAELVCPDCGHLKMFHNPHCSMVRCSCDA